MSSRPPSPKSDTEYERKKIDAVIQTDDSEVQWVWGQLPNVPSAMSSPDKPVSDETKNQNDLGIDEGQFLWY